MGNSKRNSDRRLLRSKNGGQKNEGEVRWCESAPVECNCTNICKHKGG